MFRRSVYALLVVLTLSCLVEIVSAEAPGSNRRVVFERTIRVLPRSERKAAIVPAGRADRASVGEIEDAGVTEAVPRNASEGWLGERAENPANVKTEGKRTRGDARPERAERVSKETNAGYVQKKVRAGEMADVGNIEVTPKDARGSRFVGESTDVAKQEKIPGWNQGDKSGDRGLQAELPDLEPYQRSGWDNKIVLSTVTGTNTSASTIYSDDTIYVDYCCINSGSAAAVYFRYGLYIDGVRVKHVDVTLLPAGYSSRIEDSENGPLSAGLHTFKIVCDYNDEVNESDESNNEYSRYKSIVASAKPDLEPYRRFGWDSTIVLSTVAGTGTSASTIYDDDTIYVDYGCSNSGDGDAGHFRYGLYIDGVREKYVDLSSMEAGHSGYITDSENGPLSAGTHTFKVVCDYNGEVSESNEGNNEYSRSKTVVTRGKPDLEPYRRFGWDNTIVLSTVTGTNTSTSTIYNDQTIYVDYCCANTGNASAGHFRFGLYVDGTRVEYADETSLEGGYNVAVLDSENGPFSAGSHTFKIVCDYNSEVSESDEGNNDYARSKTIVARARPDLEPYRRFGWDSTIVLSTVAGTGTSASTIYDDDTIYVDYGCTNSGDGDAGHFRYGLYIDGVRERYVDLSSMEAGHSGYITDSENGPLSAGTHTFKVICDYNYEVSESDEGNNEYSRTKTIAESPTPLPELEPYQRSGWDDKIVLSTVRGTHTSAATIYSDQLVYADYCCINRGDVAAGHFRYGLYIDGSRVKYADVDSLSSWYSSRVEDSENGPLAAGLHTFKVVCDYNHEVAESDERNNEYSRLKSLSVPVAQPDLEPYQSWNWDDKIVISTVKNTHVSAATIHDGQDIYVDYGCVNTGLGDAGHFRYGLYIDGMRAHDVYVSFLQAGAHWSYEDYEHGPLAPGLHTFQVVCDYDNDVDETNESNNAYSRSKVIAAVTGDPRIRIEPTQLSIGPSSLTHGEAVGQIGKHTADTSIKLRSGTVTPRRLTSAELDAVGFDDRQTGPWHALIQFNTLPSDSERVALKKQGVRLLNYVPHQVYWASIVDTAGPLSEIGIGGGVRWAQPAGGISNIAPRLAERLAALQANGEALPLDVHVLLFNDVDDTLAEAMLQAIGAQVVSWYSNRLIRVRVDSDLVPEIDGLDIVEWIEFAPPPQRPEGVVSAGLINVNVLWDYPYYLTGEEIEVGIWESEGRVYAHRDFDTRLEVHDNEYPATEHATHVAGIIGGSGVGNADAQGMAPKVRLSSYDSKNNLLEVQDADVDISNHSYGWLVGWYRDEGTDDWKWGDNASLFGEYTSTVSQWDELVYDTDHLIFKSAGNDRGDGPAGSTEHPQDGPYVCISGIAIAKNVLTIGAVTDGAAMADFSSWGPARDGRIKPDLVANGVSVLSTLPNNAYGSGQGTSMASPAAAGAAVLLYQRYQDINNDEPTAAVMKALLIHGASDLGRTGPDYQFGWGLIDAEASLHLIDDQNWRTGNVSGDQEDTFRVNVSQGVPTLKATLVWTDVAGSASASVALANDLDLYLRSPSGVIHRPWVLDPEHPSVSATRGTNRIDNVEQVVVTNPEAGQWQLVVHGATISQRVADYAIVSEAFSDEGTPASFTIWNDGDGILEITSMTKRDGDSWLAWSPTVPLTIQPGGFKVITVSVDLDRANTGDNEDRIRVYSNDSDKSPYPDGVYVNLHK